MIHDVISAVYRGGYKIHVSFDDGQSGTVDLSDYAERGGVFHAFKDMRFFEQFSINKELGVLTWDGQVDIAPETLYARATGQPLPAWMDTAQPTRTASRMAPQPSVTQER